MFQYFQNNDNYSHNLSSRSAILIQNNNNNYKCASTYHHTNEKKDVCHENKLKTAKSHILKNHKFQTTTPPPTYCRRCHDIRELLN